MRGVGQCEARAHCARRVRTARDVPAHVDGGVDARTVTGASARREARSTDRNVPVRAAGGVWCTGRDGSRINLGAVLLLDHVLSALAEALGVGLERFATSIRESYSPSSTPISRPTASCSARVEQLEPIVIEARRNPHLRSMSARQERPGPQGLATEKNPAPSCIEQRIRRGTPRLHRLPRRRDTQQQMHGSSPPCSPIGIRLAPPSEQDRS